MMAPSRPEAPPSDSQAEEFLRLLGNVEMRLRAFILSLVPHLSDAEDIAQETRLRLWQQFDQYDRGKDFGAWARTIAYYQVLTFREKSGRRHDLVTADFLDVVAKEINAASEELEIRQRAFARCWRKLSDIQRQLLSRYYSGQESTRQLAVDIGKTYDALRQSILRTRNALARCIDENLRQVHHEHARREQGE